MTSVAVVIPTYNDLDHVRRAAQSAAAQSPQPEELIIVDDGSTDGTAEQLERHPPLGARIIRQPNAGPAAARNLGVHAARSDIIVFLDSDDELLPGAIDAITRAFTDASPVLALGEPITASAPPPPPSPPPPPNSPPPSNSPTTYDTVARATLEAPFRGAGVMAISKRDFEHAGGFRESMRALEDLDLLLRLANTGPATLLNRATVRVEDRPHSLSRDINAVANGLATIEQALSAGEYASSHETTELIQGIRRHAAVLAASSRRPAMAARCYIRAAGHALTRRNARFLLGLPALAAWRALGLPKPASRHGRRRL